MSQHLSRCTTGTKPNSYRCQSRRKLNCDLVKACLWGRIRSVRTLLEAGADPNGADHYGTTPLLAAVGQRHFLTARLLLEAGADPNRKFAAGTPICNWETPLMDAAADGDLKMVRLLLDAGADINGTNYCGQTPLVYTKKLCRNQPERMIRFLKSRGARELTEAEHALLHAAYYGDIEKVAALIESGVNVDILNDRGSTPLHNTIPCLCRPATADERRHSLELARMLLRASADPDKVDDGRWTPLIHAAVRCETAHAKLLVRAGADVNVRSDYGSTAAMLAARRGHHAIVRLLERAGSTPKQLKECKLYHAVMIGNAPKVRDLLAAGARLLGLTEALVHAAWKGHAEVVRLLFDAGANPNEEGCYNDTALTIAAENGHASVVRAAVDACMRWTRNREKIRHQLIRAYLLAKKHSHTRCMSILKPVLRGQVDVHERNKEGETLLMLACGWDCAEEAVRFLIDAGADLNARTTNRKTALMFAAERGLAGCVQLLLEAGADAAARDRDGHTALNQASMAGNDGQSTLNLLQECTRRDNGKRRRGGIMRQKGVTPTLV